MIKILNYLIRLNSSRNRYRTVTIGVGDVQGHSSWIQSYQDSFRVLTGEMTAAIKSRRRRSGNTQISAFDGAQHEYPVCDSAVLSIGDGSCRVCLRNIDIPTDRDYDLRTSSPVRRRHRSWASEKDKGNYNHSTYRYRNRKQECSKRLHALYSKSKEGLTIVAVVCQITRVGGI